MATEQTTGLAFGMVPILEARFGDKDGALMLLHAPAGHRDFFRRLADKADLPDSPPAGIQWEPFIRGWPEGEYYVVSRTSPDTEAARPGMVATRMLALPLSSIERCDSLEPLVALMADAAAKYAPERTIRLLTTPLETVAPTPLVACVAYQLLRNDSTVAVLGQDRFASTVEELWRRLPAELRRAFSFGFSFSPADLKYTKATVVATPAACEPKWRAYTSCCGAATQTPDSESARALLSGEHNLELKGFLQELGLRLASFSDYRRYYRLWNEWRARQAQPAEGAFALLRSLGSMVGDPGSGTDQKKAALILAAKWIEGGDAEDVLAQRSVKAAAFPDEAGLLGSAIGRWIDSRLIDGSATAVQELKRVIAAVPFSQSTHWQTWVRDGLGRACAHTLSAVARTLWALLASDDVFCEVTGQLVGTAETESALLASLPMELSPLSERLEAWCLSRGWLVLTGCLILRRAGFERAVAALMAQPNDRGRESALSAVCAGQSPTLVWTAAGLHDSPTLREHAAQAALIAPSLWTDAKMGTDCWLEILDRAATLAPRFLLKADAKAISGRLFAALGNGVFATPAIWQAMEAADLLDLSERAGRTTLWSRMPEPWRGRASRRSARAWLANFYREAPPATLVLEPELVEAVLDPTLVSVTFPADSPRLGENGLRLLRAWGRERDCEHWLDALARNNQKSPPNYTGDAGQLVLANRWFDAMRRAKDYDQLEKHHYFWPIWRPLYDSLGFLERLSINYFQGTMSTPKTASPHGPSTHSVTAIFVTALTEEFAAVTARLGDRREHVENGTVYEIGRLHVEPGMDRIVAVVQTGMGNAVSAAATERALAFFKPEFAFFVGIAGGLREELTIGDVVAADKVYGYEGGKADSEFRPRPEAMNISHEAVQRANAVVRDRRWQDRILPRPKRTPHALVKPIAAGEKILVSEGAVELERIRTTYSDAHAVAMEEHGFGVALRAHPNVCCAVVRGISDLIENKEASDRAGSHEVAARNAVAFACEMLAGLIRARASDANTSPTSAVGAISRQFSGLDGPQLQ